MFTKESFAVFEITGLDQRMQAIRSEIQPIFQNIDEAVKVELENLLEEELFIHIAQHRRRSVHPPESTWSAISRQKRGYKMEPHFQLGIWPGYVTMYLSLIDQPVHKAEMAQKMLDQPVLFSQLPQDTMINLDHTSNKVEPLVEIDLTKALTRLQNVKKGEFQIGRIILKESELWQQPDAALAYMKETYQSLVPLYQGIQM